MIQTIIQGKKGYGVSRILMLLYMVVVSIAVKAQNDSVAYYQDTVHVIKEATVKGNVSSYIDPVKKAGLSEDLERYFQSLLPRRDTTYSAMMEKGHKDSFLKRFSIHTNMVDWATLVPNVGLEFDLSQTPKTHWSIGVFGKYNGRSKHTGFLYNVQSVRVETRKYWRTGNQGKVKDHIGDGKSRFQSLDYSKLDLRKPYKESVDSLNNPVREPHYTGQDSVIAEQYNGDPYRGRLYNRYHQLRRLLSTRTINNPRNWRAYYIGAYAGVDKWSISFSKNGKQGTGVYAGVIAGWSIPLLTQRFPKEGSLDLDLNLHLGLKAVKYDAFQYEDDTQHFVYDAASSAPGWKIVPYPVVQEINVGLVWRFRSIKNKVDLALVDEYERIIEKFNERRQARRSSLDAKRTEGYEKAAETKRRNAEISDSTSYANYFHERRLRNALLLNPDTVFTGEDYILKLKLIDGVDTSEKNLKLLDKQKKAAEAAAKKQADKEAAERRKQQKKEEKNKKAEEKKPEAEKGGEE